mmetsp:Transcript_1891/g.6744  ORF Transcript_1891/g.6744 Transcript_1891/m.6744 type:complete len:201 (+) Transcript_1891:3522-4124(+)
MLICICTSPRWVFCINSKRRIYSFRLMKCPKLGPQPPFVPRGVFAATMSDASLNRAQTTSINLMRSCLPSSSSQSTFSHSKGPFPQWPLSQRNKGMLHSQVARLSFSWILWHSMLLRGSVTHGTLLPICSALSSRKFLWCLQQSFVATQPKPIVLECIQTHTPTGYLLKSHSFAQPRTQSSLPTQILLDGPHSWRGTTQK